MTDRDQTPPGARPPAPRRSSVGGSADFLVGVQGDKELCTVCGVEHLVEQKDECEVEYRGHSEMLSSVYSLCEVRGVEQTTAEQARRNKRETIAFRERVDEKLVG